MRYAFVSLVAATTVLASPVERRAQTISMPLTYKSNVNNYKSLVAKGQARIAKINGQSTQSLFQEDDASGQITNADQSYLATVSIGGADYSLIVDSGSSNTWCGAQNSCEPSGTGQDTGDSVSVSYGSGSFSGEEYTDDVSFAGLTVNGQSIGAATSSNGFSGVDGILGVGPVDLTEGTVSNTNEVPTFMNNLYSQGSISEEVLGVSFVPESGSDTDDTNGELTLGGVDSSKYSGSITYFPTATSGAVAPYWGINIAEFSYGGKSLDTNQQGIVDTGTTLIYVEQTAWQKFASATGGSSDANSGLTVFNTKPTGNFGIKFGSTTFTLTPSQYLVPQAQYSYYGLSSGKYYSYIINGGSGFGGVNTIIGQKFIEQYYTVFDTTNSRIGFAPRA